jgi:hypothetical protein
MRRAIGPRQHNLLAALAAAPPPPPPGMRQEWIKSLSALLSEVLSYRRAQARHANQEVTDDRQKDHG